MVQGYTPSNRIGTSREPAGNGLPIGSPPPSCERGEELAVLRQQPYGQCIGRIP